jgi:hypothetical protein
MHLVVLALTLGMTPIHVENNYWHKPPLGPAKPYALNVRIKGAGVGGCDIIIDSNTTDTKDCSCLWGTVGYKFKAYLHDPLDSNESNELPLCEDTKSLGNCYAGERGHSYFCNITRDGFCHCDET